MKWKFFLVLLPFLMHSHPSKAEYKIYSFSIEISTQKNYIDESQSQTVTLKCELIRKHRNESSLLSFNIFKAKQKFESKFEGLIRCQNHLNNKFHDESMLMDVQLLPGYVNTFPKHEWFYPRFNLSFEQLLSFADFAFSIKGLSFALSDYEIMRQDLRYCVNMATEKVYVFQRYQTKSTPEEKYFKLFSWFLFRKYTKNNQGQILRFKFESEKIIPPLKF